MKYFVTTTRNNINRNPFDRFFSPFFDFKPMGSFMKTDVSEVDGNICLEIEMPGFDKNDISLKLEDGFLTVSAEKAQKDEDAEKYLSRERKTSLSRSFEIGEVSVESIKAKYDNGVLTVTFPKEAEKVQAAQIAVE